MSMNLVTLCYLVASVCFIQALKGLSHPTTSIRGNIFGMVGMAIAAFTTAALIYETSHGQGMGLAWVLLGLVAGGAYGAYRAKTVEMTKMPILLPGFVLNRKNPKPGPVTNGACGGKSMTLNVYCVPLNSTGMRV